MAVTAKDVARELNLSSTTVTRVFSGDQRDRIPEATRERVFEAAKRLGYQPNAVASSLRRGRTDIIGFHTGRHCDARNEFYSVLIGSLQDSCHRHDMDLLLHSVKDNLPVETMIAKLTSRRVDGLILRATIDDPLLDGLRASSLPVVAVADPLPGIPTVTCDGEEGINQLIDQLWLRGYRDYVFLEPRLAIADIEIRRRAFEAALTHRGVLPSGRQVIPIEFECAEEALPQLMASGKRLAVCCWNDRAAYNLLAACAISNVAVPERLAVTGFDGFEETHYNPQRLVTIKCPWDQVAITALEMLVGMIEKRGKEDEDTPDIIRMPVFFRGGNTA